MEKVLLTGATGFIGYNIALELLNSSYALRLLVRNNNPFPDNDLVECVYGDIQNYHDVESAINGCDYVIHTAGLFTFDSRDKKAIYATNVDGTRNVCLAIANNQNIKRFIYTSSAATIGKAKQGLSSETTTFNLWNISSHYKKSKVLAERVVCDFLEKYSIPVVILNPSLPLGSYDKKPTPTGMMVKSFLDSKRISFIDGGFNFVHVKDVAKLHVLALKSGNVGEKYIVGNANLDLESFYKLLQPYNPQVRLAKVPYVLALLFSFLHAVIEKLKGNIPYVTPRGVQLSRKKMFYDNTKVKETFGYEFIPIQDAIQDSVMWFFNKK